MSGLTFHREEGKARSAAAFVADRRLALTADRSRVVPYEHPDAAWLFKAPGQTVTAEEAERYGLSAPGGIETTPDGTEKPAPEAKQAEKPSDKAVEKAEVEDKAVGRRKKAKT